MTLPPDFELPSFLFSERYENVTFFPYKSAKDFCFDETEFTPRHIRKMKNLRVEKVISLDEWRDLSVDRPERFLVCFPLDD